MGSRVSIYNVLLYEPQAIGPDLRIARWILSDIKAMANQRFPGGIIPSGFPEAERFIVNLMPYGQHGRVPAVLGDLDRAYRQMAPKGIAVSFFNTACSGPTCDYERLAEVLDEFPAIRESAWVVTSSLRTPMPKGFMKRIAEHGRDRAPDMTHMVPMGDSIVVRAKSEAVRWILAHLRCLRSAEMVGSRAPDPDGRGPKPFPVPRAVRLCVPDATGIWRTAGDQQATAWT